MSPYNTLHIFLDSKGDTVSTYVLETLAKVLTMASIMSKDRAASLQLQPLVSHELDDWEEGHTHAADQKHKAAEDTSKITFKERLKHVTWAWFTLTMSTGGLALLLHSTPHQFRGLDVIGKIVFIGNLCLFTVLLAGITTRFILTPRALRASLTHPTESLFFPCVFLSAATIIANSGAYGKSMVISSTKIC